MLKRSVRLFGYSNYPNTPTIATEYVEGTKHVYDAAIERYQPLVKAYLEKRWIQKSEIC